MAIFAALTWPIAFIGIGLSAYIFGQWKTFYGLDNQDDKDSEKDLNYYKNNAEEDYISTPISVLRYISELEDNVR